MTRTVQFVMPFWAYLKERGDEDSVQEGKGMYCRVPWGSVMCSPVSLMSVLATGVDGRRGKGLHCSV